MIALVKGRLFKKDTSGTVIVDSGSVGYRIFVSLNTLFALPEEGEDVTLHTVTVVREDAMNLYGFAEPEEMKFFNLLVQVKGVGPRLALSLLSGIKTRDLANAISKQDSGWICAVPGVGRKTAERIILELKDKVEPMEGYAKPSSLGLDEQIAADVVSALVNLGYRASDSRASLGRIMEGREDPLPFNELIRKCLADLTGRKANG
ncbi:MAG: Holliday junction branch migration protein RuvA [bacterium]|nr:MAG: Holliday junction branch migration protein RuvA [bacterium]